MKKRGILLTIICFAVVAALLVTVISASSLVSSSSNQAVATAQNICPGQAASCTKTTLSATTVELGQSVTDNVKVTSKSASTIVPSGTVQFKVQVGAGIWTTYDTETLVNGVATSIAYMPMAVGADNFQAIYSGDSNYLGSTSVVGSEPLTVTPASSMATTVLGASSITLGSYVTDNVTVVGLGGSFPEPSGTVDFQVSFNSGAWTTYDASVALVDGTATSRILHADRGR